MPTSSCSSRCTVSPLSTCSARRPIPGREKSAERTQQSVVRRAGALLGQLDTGLRTAPEVAQKAAQECARGAEDETRLAAQVIIAGMQEAGQEHEAGHEPHPGAGKA